MLLTVLGRCKQGYCVLHSCLQALLCKRKFVYSPVIFCECVCIWGINNLKNNSLSVIKDCSYLHQNTNINSNILDCIRKIVPFNKLLEAVAELQTAFKDSVNLRYSNKTLLSKCWSRLKSSYFRIVCLKSWMIYRKHKVERSTKQETYTGN